jgi:hypothetical protein
MTSTMQAAVVEQFGKPLVLKELDILLSLAQARFL